MKLQYGIDDIINFEVAPTPYILKDVQRSNSYNTRIQRKNWENKWPNLTFNFI